MKLIFASLLSLLSVVAGESDLNPGYQFHVWGMGATADGDEFTVTVNHNGADTPDGGSSFEGNRVIYLFKECPHGGAETSPTLGLNSDNDLTDAMDGGWFDMGDAGVVTTPDVGGADPNPHTEEQDTNPWSTTFTFTVKPQVSAVSGVWTGSDMGDGVTESPGGIDAEGEAEFCIFFGLGTGGTTYGFMELIVTARFQFDGTFKLTKLSTAAYDPVTANETTMRKFYTRVIKCNPTQPIRPGTPACLRVCPMAGDQGPDGIYVKSVNWLKMTETDEWANSAPERTTAEDETMITSLATYNVVCDGDNGVKTDIVDSINDDVQNFCCVVTFLLPIIYFPTSAVSAATPTKTWFTVVGRATVEPSYKNGGRRALQEDDVEPEAEASGDVDLELIPEEASGSSRMAVAAAGVLGAAALMI